MLIHNRIESSSVNGPGNRAVIWVQGCTLGCHGCWNPDTHAFGGQELSTGELMNWIDSLPEDVIGLTLSGGEPMQQAPGLLLFLRILKEERPEFSIGMYTGYTLKELEANKYHWFNIHGELVKASGFFWKLIKETLDFAIMGRYVEAKRSQERPLCGSSNQEVVFFTDRYSEGDLSQQAFELTIDENTGLTQISGFPIGVDLSQL
jgi:anaerobic ribonucleoside-triphosphate reductase activating protein